MLSLANSAALSSGLIQFGGGTLQFSPSNTNDYSALIFNSTGPISLDTNGQTVTFASNLDGSNVGGLTKVGNGLLTLSGNNNYSGATLVSAGTLAVTGTGSLSSSTGNVEVGTNAGSPAALVFGPASVTNLTTPRYPAYGSLRFYRNGPGRRIVHHGRIRQNRQPGQRIVGNHQSIRRHGVDQRRRCGKRQSFADHRRVFGGNSAYNLSGGSLIVPNGTCLPALERQRHPEYFQRLRHRLAH